MTTCLQCDAPATLRSVLVTADGARIWRVLCDRCGLRTRPGSIRSYVLDRETVGGTEVELRYEPRNEAYGAYATYACNREGCVHDADARKRGACFLPLDSDDRGADARHRDYLDAQADFREYTSGARVGLLADELEASADVALRALIVAFRARPRGWWRSAPPELARAVLASQVLAQAVQRVRRLRSRAWGVRDVAERPSTSTNTKSRHR